MSEVRNPNRKAAVGPAFPEAYQQLVGMSRLVGEEERRLYVLSAWRETTLFTEQERAALALTEALTTLSQHQDVPDDVYDRAAEVFTQRQLTVVVWAATVINTFNRFGVAGRVPLPARA
jgi:alkylhydroperoxidase family enzyme